MFLSFPPLTFPSVLKATVSFHLDALLLASVFGVNLVSDYLKATSGYEQFHKYKTH